MGMIVSNQKVCKEFSKEHGCESRACNCENALDTANAKLIEIPL
jgi:hypothetical protein